MLRRNNRRVRISLFVVAWLLVTSVPLSAAQTRVTINLGPGVGQIAFGPGNLAYIDDAGQNQVAVLDATSGVLLGRVGVPGIPADVAIDPLSGKALVVAGSNRIEVVDGSTLSLGTPIALPHSRAYRLAVSAALGQAFVFMLDQSHQAYLVAVDLRTRLVVHDAPVNAVANELVVDSVSGHLYAAFPSGVGVFDAATLAALGTIGTSSAIGELALDEVNHRLYALSGDAVPVAVIDTTNDTVIGGLSGVGYGMGVAVDPGSDRVFVVRIAGGGGGRLEIFEAGSLTDAITFGTEPRYVAVNRATGVAWVADELDGTVTLVSRSSDQTPPTLTTPVLAPNPVRAGSPLTVTATASDGTGVASAQMTIRSATTGFITRTGTQLGLNGQPYQFTGLNLYSANNVRNNGCTGTNLGSGTALGATLDQWGGGKQVMRAWFFQPLAQTTVQPGAVRDWSAFDHTLSVAAAHGLKVIATLTDQWGECGDGGLNGFKTMQWYVDGYKTTPDTGLIATYRNYVAEVVARYKDDPRIAFWQLVNEAEIRTDINEACPGANQRDVILRDFAADVSGLVKSIDSNHLVSLGTIGSGQCGTEGAQYENVHNVPTIDLCEYHDYTPVADLGGDQYNGLLVRLQQCSDLHKPIFIGEAGIRPNDVGGTYAARAARFASKHAAVMAAGAVGFVAWNWEATGSALDTYAIGPGDPALAALADFEPSTQINAADGAFGGPSEGLTATVAAPATPGTYSVCVLATDTTGNRSDGTSCTSLTVIKANQTITFANPGTRTLLQSPLIVTATASSSLPVTLTSTTPSVCTVTGVAITFATTGSCSITATQAGNATYTTAPTVTRTFTINKANQTITFANPGTHTMTQSPLIVTATASSSLPVTLTSTTTSVCTLAGFTISFETAGTCSITATQAGNGTYNAAPTITRTFTVNKTNQTITFANPGARSLMPPTSDPASHPSVVTSATATSGLPVTLTSNNPAVCTVSDFTVTLLSAGTCSLTASQGGDATYKAAPSITRTFAVKQVNQTITFVNPGTQSIHLPTVNTSPWATSDLPVTLSSNSTGVCTASGTTITLVAIGTCSISTAQPGNTVYRAAPTVTRTFTVVDQVNQTIVLPNPGAQSLLVLTVLASPWASSGLPVTLTSTTLPVCTVSGDLITLHAAGSCALTATQPGDVAHKAAPAVHQTFTVSASTPLGFVTANGTHLQIDGQAFVFDGAAVYHASSGNPAQTPAQAIALASQAKLNIVRLSDIFDQSGNDSGDPYRERDWSRQDEIIARARGAGMRVVLDLSSFRNYLVNRDIRLSAVNCAGGALRTPADYLAVDPYRPALEGEWETFLSWVVNRVNTVTGVRYRDDPTIAVISMAGEPHGSGTEDCGKAVSPSDLTEFYARTLGYLASIDPNHLRSNGGLTQTDWRQVYGGTADSGIDGEAIFAISANTLPSLHTYPAVYAPNGTPIDYQSLHLGAYALSLHKPWFTEEFGWAQHYGDVTRASYYQWLYTEQVSYGSSGALFWNLGNEISFGTYDVGPSTPLTWGVVLAH